MSLPHKEQRTCFPSANLQLSLIPRAISTICFQFWREHIQETPILHFRVNMFWEMFSSYRKNKSPVQNLQNSNTSITYFDLARKISNNWFLTQKEKFPLKLCFLVGPNTAEILLVLCKIGVSEKYPEKQLGPSATLGKLHSTAENST